MLAPAPQSEAQHSRPYSSGPGLPAGPHTPVHRKRQLKRGLCRFFQVEGPGDRPGVRQGSKSRSSRWSQGLSDDEDGEGEPDEAELDADLAGSASAAHRGKRAPTGSASTLNPASSPSGGGFTRRWQGKKRRGQQQPPRQASDDSDLDAEAQAALEQLASPCSRHTARCAARLAGESCSQSCSVACWCSLIQRPAWQRTLQHGREYGVVDVIKSAPMHTWPDPAQPGWCLVSCSCALRGTEHEPE